MLRSTWKLSMSLLRRTLFSVSFVLLALVGSSTTVFAQDDASNQIIQDLAEELTHRKTASRLAAIEQLSLSAAPRKEIWLTAILEGSLYMRKEDKRMVTVVKDGSLFSMTDAITGESLGEEKKRALTKIKINNAIRGKIRSTLGSIALTDPDVQKRNDAVVQLFGSASSDIVEQVRELLNNETDAQVQRSMLTLISIHDLKNGSADQKEAALIFAEGKLEGELVNTLRDMSTSESSDELRLEAQRILQVAEKKQQWYARAETVFFGLSLGSVLVLAAIGLAVTFGVMGVINMAHGELLMLGAYTTYFIQQWFPDAITYSLLLAVPAAFVVSGSFGILIERGVIRHLYGRPLETLLATFGISLILQQTVRTFVSSQNVAVINPSWMSGSWIINPAFSLTWNRVYIIAFCLCVFFLLLVLITRSNFGLQMRAVAQNRQMARAMGIRSARVDALTFGLGSGIAGIAGVALSQLGNVGPNLGQNYIIDSFMVVVFGGVGNLWGTLVAGMTLGIANKVAEPMAGAVVAKILILVFIILFIQRKPRGLFPQRGRAAES